MEENKRNRIESWSCRRLFYPRQTPNTSALTFVSKQLKLTILPQLICDERSKLQQIFNCVGFLFRGAGAAAAVAFDKMVESHFFFPSFAVAGRRVSFCNLSRSSLSADSWCNVTDGCGGTARVSRSVRQSPRARRDSEPR